MDIRPAEQFGVRAVASSHDDNTGAVIRQRL
jgi:hypothetical protein